MAWQRFAVQLKGEDQPVVVQTGARDWSAVTIDPGAPRAMDMTFQVVHAALLRTGHDVPRDYDGFLEVLDAIPDALDEQDDALLDPTNAERSDV